MMKKLLIGFCVFVAFIIILGLGKSNNAQTIETTETNVTTDITEKTDSSESSVEDVTVYECDVRSLNLNTEIHISGNNAKRYVIKGDILSFVTDPLTLYEDGKVLGYAGDAYHYIAQDSHSICLDGKIVSEMVGEVVLFGDRYTIYGSDQNLLGTLEVQYTSGSFVDTNGQIVATYSSPMFLKDFVVKIYNHDMMPDEAILLLFASYYSDYEYDKR